MANLAGVLVKVLGRWTELGYWPVLQAGIGPDGNPVILQTSSSGGSTVAISGTVPNGHTASAGSNITPSGTQTIPAGAISVEFLLFPSAVGTVNGITLDNTSSNIILQYRLDAPDWRPLTAVTYVLTAGSGALTVQTAVP